MLSLTKEVTLALGDGPLAVLTLIHHKYAKCLLLQPSVFHVGALFSRATNVRICVKCLQPPSPAYLLTSNFESTVDFSSLTCLWFRGHWLEEEERMLGGERMHCTCAL